LSGQTTCLMPNIPKMLLDPALRPLVSNIIVSRSINGNGFVYNNNLFYLLCILYSQLALFLLSQVVTTLPYYLPCACHHTLP
jgi:hypothetical protein